MITETVNSTALEERVLVLAPTGRDAELICEALCRAGLRAEAFNKIGDLTNAIMEGAGTAILAGEVMSQETLTVLAAELARQPAWSDFPIIILTSSAESSVSNWQLAEAIREIRHVNLLERPLRPVTLLSAVRVAIQARRRQYQLRDELVRRDETERALRESEERLRFTLEAARVGTWLWDIAMNRVQWSDNLEEIHGGVRGSFDGTFERVMQEVIEEDRERVIRAIQDAVGNGAPYRVEYRVLDQQGWIRWLEGVGRVTYDDEGHPSSMAGICTDVTDRRQAEDARRQSDRIYRGIGESIDYGIWICDPQGRNIYASESFLKLVGLTQQQCSPFGWSEALHPDQVQPTIDAWMSCVRTGSFWEREHLFRGVNGQWHPVLARGVPIRNDAGDILCWAGIHLDISSLKQTEQELREKTRSLETINQVNASLAGELETRRLLQGITDAATNVSGAQFGAFFYNVQNEEGDPYMLYTLSAVEPEVFTRFPMPRNTDLFGPTFRGEGIIRTDDVTRDPRFGTKNLDCGLPEDHPPVRSYLAAPVLSRSGGVIGGLFLGHEMTGIFTEQTEQIIAGIAAQASIALDNARLFESAQRFKFISDHAADAHFFFNEEGSFLYVNKLACEGLQYSAEELLGMSIGDVDPRLSGEGVANLFRRLDEQRLAPFESLLRRRDGSTFPVEISVSVVVFNDERYAFAVARDITERKEAEYELSKLAAIVESSQDAIVGEDLECRIISWNDGARRMYGYSAEEAVGRHASMLVPPEKMEEFDRMMSRVQRGRRTVPLETVRVAKDGRRIHVSLTLSPVRDDAGMIIGASAIARDITRQKQAEEHQQLLLAELQHRVKNTLTAVLNIASQTRRRVDSLEAFAESYEGRLQALARAHGLLTRSNWKSASLRELAEQTLAPYRTAEADQVRIEGADVAIAPKAALALGMVLHELATNAAKYGALSANGGRIDLHWRIESDQDPRQFRLYWEESGGPPVRTPRLKGFGSELIERSVSYELAGQAELKYQQDGLRCSLWCPITGQVFPFSMDEKESS